MKTSPVEIICIIDRSGSMSAIESDAVGGFNRFLTSQQALGDDALITLVLFDHEYEVVHRNLPIRLVRPLDAKTYAPRGTTALLDAIGRTIEDVSMRHAAGEYAGRVVVAILTDGLENASRDYARTRVAELIDRQQREAGWQFVFLAANQDVFAEARSLRLDASSAMAFDASPDGLGEAYDMLHSRIEMFRNRP